MVGSPVVGGKLAAVITAVLSKGNGSHRSGRAELSSRRAAVLVSALRDSPHGWRPASCPQQAAE